MEERRTTDTAGRALLVESLREVFGPHLSVRAVNEKLDKRKAERNAAPHEDLVSELGIFMLKRLCKGEVKGKGKPKSFFAKLPPELSVRLCTAAGFKKLRKYMKRFPVSKYDFKNYDIQFERFMVEFRTVKHPEPRHPSVPGANPGASVFEGLSELDKSIADTWITVLGKKGSTHGASRKLFMALAEELSSGLDKADPWLKMSLEGWRADVEKALDAAGPGDKIDRLVLMPMKLREFTTEQINALVIAGDACIEAMLNSGARLNEVADFAAKVGRFGKMVQEMGIEQGKSNFSALFPEVPVGHSLLTLRQPAFDGAFIGMLFCEARAVNLGSLKRFVVDVLLEALADKDHFGKMKPYRSAVVATAKKFSVRISALFTGLLKSR